MLNLPDASVANPSASAKESSCDIGLDTSNNIPSTSGNLIMIDTTKTANQKRKEAAAARRNEKAQQKQAAKIAAARNGASAAVILNGAPST